jgi:thiol-disulfide isomerase/thioredoxin
MVARGLELGDIPGKEFFMMKHVRLAVALAALAGFVANIQAAAKASLKVGDPAPKLQVAKWVQGEPVKEFSKDKAYIVEFWATWCGPCRVSIPHLNEIHNKYKDKGLIVIGQDCWEQDEDEVPKFVKQMGDKMTYRVALDDKNGSEKGKMAETWMEAAGQNGIPTAFVVSKTGHIAWIGHPMSLKEKVLDDVLAGNFDAGKAAAEYQKKKEQEEKTAEIWQNFQKAANDKEWDKAEGYLGEMEQLMDEEDRGNLDMIRLQMNLKKEDMPGAEKIAKRLSEKEPENAMYHNELSWRLITQKGISKGLVALAEKEATRANDLSKGKNSEILDTLARVQFVKGAKDEAIATQQKAIDMADEKAKKNYQKTLDSYKAGKIPGEES